MAETLLCGDEGRKKGEQEVSSLQVEDFLSDRLSAPDWFPSDLQQKEEESADHGCVCFVCLGT